MHLLALHEHGSNNPLGVSGNTDRLPFHPYFTFKDLVTIFFFLLLLSLIVFYTPNLLGQLWPYDNASVALSLKCAICWDHYELVLTQFWGKTDKISYKTRGKISIYSAFSRYTKSVRSYFKKCNQQITNLQDNEVVGISETLRAKNIFTFGPWLAGLIDGDGCFLISQKGYVSCEITLPLEDEKVLIFIQDKLHGGSIKRRSGCKAVRIRFHNKIVMEKLINIVNGYIYNSIRLPQFIRVCEKLNINSVYPDYNKVPLPWFMGFIDADGTVNYYPHYTKDKRYYRNQLTLAVGNKYHKDLLPFLKEFGGKIYFDKGGGSSFIWKINRKDEHLSFYKKFLTYPCKSIKSNRIFLFKEYYYFAETKAFRQDKNSAMYKSWLYFLSRWNRRT